MVGWHHRLNGRGFGWTAGVGDGQRGLAVVHGVTKSWTPLRDWTDWLMFESVYLVMFCSSVVFIFLDDQIISFDPVGAFSNDFLIPFNMTLIVFDCFLSIWYDKTFQTHLTYFQSGIWNQPFCQGILILSVISRES